MKARCIFGGKVGGGDEICALSNAAEKYRDLERGSFCGDGAGAGLGNTNERRTAESVDCLDSEPFEPLDGGDTLGTTIIGGGASERTDVTSSDVGVDSGDTFGLGARTLLGENVVGEITDSVVSSNERFATAASVKSTSTYTTSANSSTVRNTNGSNTSVRLHAACKSSLFRCTCMRKSTTTLCSWIKACTSIIK